jgi:hypothetical protein
VINLRQLNEFVEYHHFKQENLKFVLDLVQKFHYLTSVDLCDAEFQKYLCFSWKNQYYVFRVRLFGLASAPRNFTKLQKPVFTWLRYQAIKGRRVKKPFTASVIDDVEYLLHLVNINSSYSVINTHKSMLMQTLPFFGASWCNNPTLIPRFMKGFFNIKPLPYKPNLTWDVSKVLKFISTLMPLEFLNLKMLTYNLIALVALTTAARAQTLSALYLNYMSLFHDKVSFTICSLLKT